METGALAFRQVNFVASLRRNAVSRNSITRRYKIRSLNLDTCRIRDRSRLRNESPTRV